FHFMAEGFPPTRRPQARPALGPDAQRALAAETLARPSSIDLRTGLPFVALIRAAAIRPLNEVGVRCQVTWMRLPPSSRDEMAADTKLPGVQTLLSRTIHVTTRGTDHS